MNSFQISIKQVTSVTPAKAKLTTALTI